MPNWESLLCSARASPKCLEHTARMTAEGLGVEFCRSWSTFRPKNVCSFARASAGVKV